MNGIPIGYYMALAGLLFALGVAGVLLRRSAIVVLMSIELMLNAANLTFAAAARSLGQMDGQVYVFFSLTVAAAEVAVGLALVVAVYRAYGATDVDNLRGLRG